MQQITNIILSVIILASFSSFVASNNPEALTLRVEVNALRNSDGVVQFTLYNQDGSIPDANYEKYYLQSKAEISNNTSTFTFKNIPKGVYAVNILHDEDEDGKIKKGWILPQEGIGFSNLKSLNPMNRPSFKKTKFEVNANMKIEVKVIYK